jgi:uncharacterized protein DUF4260
MTPRNLLSVEGAAVFLASISVFFAQGNPWWLFVLLILAPDLAMLGYLVGPAIGSYVYNSVHLYVWPLALIAYTLYSGNPLTLQFALIWAAHIGMDRMLGYGLKYPSAFKDTHLQRV